MILSEIGKIANQFWQEIPAHFPFVNLDEFVVMPNHVHGILEINKNCFGNINCRDEALPRLGNNERYGVNQQHQNEILQYQDEIKNQNNNKHQDEAQNRKQDETERGNQDEAERGNQDEAVPRLYGGEYPRMSEISPKPGSLAVIIGSFKSIVSKTANKQFPIGFHWQPKFYDHIIRNDKALNKIREYIITNPERWERDRNLPDDGWGVFLDRSPK